TEITDIQDVGPGAGVEDQNGVDAVEVAQVGRRVRGNIEGVIAGAHVQGGGETEVADVRRVGTAIDIELQRCAGVVDREGFGQGSGVGADEANEAEGAAAGIVGNGTGGEAGDGVAPDENVAVTAGGAEVADCKKIGSRISGNSQGALDASKRTGVGRRV